jgi:hypothetical protein
VYVVDVAVDVFDGFEAPGAVRAGAGAGVGFVVAAGECVSARKEGSGTGTEGGEGWDER